MDVAEDATPLAATPPRLRLLGVSKLINTGIHHPLSVEYPGSFYQLVGAAKIGNLSIQKYQ